MAFHVLGGKKNCQIFFKNILATALKSYIKWLLYIYILGCANKDLAGYLGPLGKFIEYCRITALLPVIPLGIRNNW